MLCATAVMVEFLFEMLHICELSCTLLALALAVIVIDGGSSLGSPQTWHFSTVLISSQTLHL